MQKPANGCFRSQDRLSREGWSDQSLISDKTVGCQWQKIFFDLPKYSHRWSRWEKYSLRWLRWEKYSHYVAKLRRCILHKPGTLHKNTLYVYFHSLYEKCFTSPVFFCSHLVGLACMKTKCETNLDKLTSSHWLHKKCNPLRLWRNLQL